MGYDDLYWFTNYTSSFGNEAQLRSMINTFKNHGLGTIADVVINHRKDLSDWVVFPAETYKGVTYQLTANDICSDDEAAKQGYQLGPNKDTGEGWDGMRDLDHKSENVQTNVKAYLKFLLNDLGYTGFRYDMVKGYSAEFTGLYNSDSQPQFSVGEYWDGDAAKVQKWIDGTKVDDKIQSAAFDFPFRYAVRDAISGGWNKLLTPGMINNSDYRRYSVTFVENHDTEYRSSSSPQDPIMKDTLAANAFMLAMPGTPCVFFKHWQAYKPEIKAMIEARKLAGITNTSDYKRFFVGNPTQVNTAYYANTIDDKLLVVVGNESKLTPDADKWTRILSGYHYAYYLARSLETAWANQGSGDFSEAFDVVLTAVSASSGAKLVYTIDGFEPSASKGTQVETGTKIRIDKTTTLKVGLLVGGSVSGVITREFTYKEKEQEPTVEIPDFCKVGENEVCAFFEAPASWSETIYCWAWTDSPADNFTSKEGKWPGVACDCLGTAKNGNQVWKWTWDGTKQNNSSAKQPAMIIFSNSGSPQTADLEFKNGGYYTKSGLFDVVAPTGIRPVTTDTQGTTKIYTLDGRQVRTANKGVYIVNGKKRVLK
jgi:alpha-amylase